MHNNWVLSDIHTGALLLIAVLKFRAVDVLIFFFLNTVFQIDLRCRIGLVSIRLKKK